MSLYWKAHGYVGWISVSILSCGDPPALACGNPVICYFYQFLFVC
jgi:hypothetical protein